MALYTALEGVKWLNKILWESPETETFKVSFMSIWCTGVYPKIWWLPDWTIQLDCCLVMVRLFGSTRGKLSTSIFKVSLFVICGVCGLCMVRMTLKDSNRNYHYD